MKEREKRVSKDSYFLNMAAVVAERATCPRLHVGSVIAKDDMVISTGYNGAPRGLEHCEDVGCKIVNEHCVRVVHSEVNAILQAAYHGIPTNGASLYTLYLSCENCAKVIINAGIKRVVFRYVYKNIDQPATRELFEKAEIDLVGDKE